MAEYVVSLDDEASNELANNLSLVGRVNNIPCATVIRLSSIKGLSPAKAKQVKQRALIEAFLAQTELPVSTGQGERVVL